MHRKWQFAAVLVAAVAIVATVFTGAWVASADGPRWAVVDPTGIVVAVSSQRQDFGAPFVTVEVPDLDPRVKPVLYRYDHTTATFVLQTFEPRATATPAPGGTGIAPTPAPTATPTVGPTATPTPVPTPRIFSGDTNADLEAVWLEVDALKAENEALRARLDALEAR